MDKTESFPVSRFITRMAYGLNQLPRVAWYIGHGLAVRRETGKELKMQSRKSLYSERGFALNC
jgi:hypothetical protein